MWCIGVVNCGHVVKKWYKKLTLIDHDILGWHNLGRHILGSNYVNCNKAKALSSFFLRKFPDATVNSIDKKIQFVHHQDPKLLESFDLLISATGDWSTDVFIENLISKQIGLAAGLFAWVEPFGVAGHACFVSDDLPRLTLFSDAFGKPKCKVISDDNSVKILKEPFCGGEYQEFGAVNLSSIASMTSRFVLEVLNSENVDNCWRVWISSKRDFCDNLISISKFWYDKPNNLFDSTHSLSDTELS